MALLLKAEPGSPSMSASTIHKNYNEMSISQLVSVLRVAFETEDFDKVEDELVNRDAKLKAEIEPLRAKIEVERLKRIEAEEKLKRREEQCEKGKRAQENYEQLLREVKKKGLVEKKNTEGLRKKNLALEHEICELKELKKKWLDDDKSVGDLRSRISVLEGEKVGDKSAFDALSAKNSELEESVKKNLTVLEELRKKNHSLECEVCKLKELKKKWLNDGTSLAELQSKIFVLEEEKVGDKSALDALGKKNRELEEAIKTNLTAIEGLMTKNGKLAGENHKYQTRMEFLERKFGGLGVRLVKLEDDINLLISKDCGVTYAVKDEENVGDRKLENDTGGLVPFQRNEDHSLDAGTAQSRSKENKDALGASGVKLELKNDIEFIDLGDDDDDDDADAGCTSKGLHGKKAISQIIAENEHPSSSNAIQHKSIFTEAQRIEAIKRKCLSDIQISASTSSLSDDSSEFDENYPPKKRRRTSPDSPGLNSLPSFFLKRKI